MSRFRKEQVTLLVFATAVFMLLPQQRMCSVSNALRRSPLQPSAMRSASATPIVTPSAAATARSRLRTAAAVTAFRLTCSAPIASTTRIRSCSGLRLLRPVCHTCCTRHRLEPGSMTVARHEKIH